jgi:hypothetical protein
MPQAGFCARGAQSGKEGRYFLEPSKTVSYVHRESIRKSSSAFQGEHPQ